MTAAIKRWIVRVFNAFGLDVRRIRPQPPPRASFTESLRQLARLGFQPRTLIDVGVAYHTQTLYQQFPSAAILLIEPLAEFEASLRLICSKYKAQYVLAAAGAGPGHATINVHADKTGSSLLREVEGASVDGTPRRVPVVTIDQECATRNLTGPFLIKIDVLGAELQVLAGAVTTLKQTEVVILEARLFGLYEGGSQLYDIVSKMKEFGFVIYDVYGLLYRPLDSALAQINLLFVREDGLFRKSHAFATPEQRAALAQAGIDFATFQQDA